MISSDFILILLLSSLAIAPLVHLVIAYYVAPKRAKAALLDALVNDDTFQLQLIGTIVRNLLRPIKFKMPDGTEEDMPAIDPVIKRAMTEFQMWIQGKQGKFAQEMTQQMTELGDIQAQGGNPLEAILLAQIPKSFRKYLPIVMQIIQGRQQNSY
jgi:hypothetical protein